MSFKTILTVAALLCLFSCSSKKGSNKSFGYVIDKNIKAEVEKRITKEEGMILGQMDVRLLENDMEVQSTFGKDKKIPFFTMTSVNKDLISISGIAGMFSGFGFELYIQGDSCGVFLYITTDDPEIYKAEKTDTAYKGGLLVPTRNSKVILSRMPNPKELSASKPLEGYVEFESKEFYQKSDDGDEDKKIKMFIKAYFKTEEITSHR